MSEGSSDVRWIPSVVVLALVATLGVGCGRVAGPTGGKLKIGFVSNNADDFWTIRVVV